MTDTKFTPEFIAELRGLIEKATPGSWKLEWDWELRKEGRINAYYYEAYAMTPIQKGDSIGSVEPQVTADRLLVEVSREVLPDALDEIERLHAEIEQLKEEQRWIPISERLPEEGQPVLIDFGNNEITVGIWFWEIEPEEWNGTYYVGWQHWNYRWDKFFPSDEPPLHWQPLPQPPQEETK